MSNSSYYEAWIKLKEQISATLAEDERLQYLANKEIGVKPQGTAVEVVSRVYSRYCTMYNKLCDCYDQMAQVQRRAFIKKIIDAMTCRILELKFMLEEVEAFEFTYPDNGLQQLMMIPQDIEILCPFFYPYEIRQEEKQYIIDQIFAGNRLGDPTPTPSELEQREELRLEEEKRIQEEKEAELRRKLAIGDDIVISEPSIVLTPEELEEIRLLEEYNRHTNNIQRMERCRKVTRHKTRKFNKDNNEYLELAGLKVPPAKEKLRIVAAQLIQLAYRRFMEIKRENYRDYKLRLKLGMIMPSNLPPSAKIRLDRVKEERRNFRRKYHKSFLEKNMKENARIFKLRENDIMDDITAEINQWLREWYTEVKVFDEFPYPEEGGSILIVRGDTMTIKEYIEWRIAEDKRIKAEASAPKTKEEKKAEKKYEKEEKKRIEKEARQKEVKRMLDYKKSRHNPDSDPGIYLYKGKTLEKLQDAWFEYQNQWRNIDIDIAHAPEDAVKGYIMQLITENAYRDIQFQLRPIVDEVMKLELKILNYSLRNDYLASGVKKPPKGKKRRKPKAVPLPKPENDRCARMFQDLVDSGIIRKYEPFTLDDFWGDRNYAAADMRATLWTPSFPPPCFGDVRDLVRTRCILALGSSCSNVVRRQLIVGPKGCGKKSLIYAVATETNSILIDLSPKNVYDKYPGKKIKRMFQYVVRISKLMAPTVIMIADADKMFYKKVPPQEKSYNPTRLQKSIFKDFIRTISNDDKVMVIGTASEPWLSKNPAMYKVFPSVVMIPRSDYGSIFSILSKMLFAYHGVCRDFNVHSLAQTIKGYDIRSIINSVKTVMTPERIAVLYNKPLQPKEFVEIIIENVEAECITDNDMEMYNKWYLSYSPWGEKYLEYMAMINSQYTIKLKNDKKESKAKE